MTNKPWVITTIKERPELYQLVIELLERTFQYNQHYSIAIDFHPLLSETNAENLFIVLDQQSNKPIAHLGVKVSQLSSNGTHFPIALIGGVAVDENFRGLGLQRLLMDHIHQKYNDQCTLFFLWSNLDQLYQKHNYSQIGCIFELGNKDIKYLSQVISPPLKFNQIEKNDKQNMANLHRSTILNKYTAPLRSDAEWEQLYNVTSANIYLIKNSLKKLIGYLIADKGMDLQGIIHEFCFGPEVPKELIQEINQFKIWVPEKKQDHYQKQLFSCLTRIGNSHLFQKFISQWSQNSIRITSIEHSPSLVKFKFNSSQFELSHEEFLTGIWGPNYIDEFKGLGKPLFFPGLDSI